MKRLTYKDERGAHFIDSCYTGGGFINVEKLKTYIAELEDKLESGLLVELPCEIEATLYIIHLPKLRNELIECLILKMEFTGGGWQIKLCESGFRGTRTFLCFYDLRGKAFLEGVSSNDVGYPHDMVFTDKSQAEARLKELVEKQ